MKIPSLPFAPEDFFRYPKLTQLPHYGAGIKAPDLEDIARLHELVKTGTLREVENKLGGAGWNCDVANIGVLYMAIEPTTGDSLLHTAVLAQRMDLLREGTLLHFRSHCIPQYRHVFYALHRHQNHDGDTVIHSAVRTGKMDILEAVLKDVGAQYVYADSLGEVLRSDEAAVKEGTAWDDYNEEEMAMRIGKLVVLLQANAEGRTAAQEARALGHTEMAEWLDRVPLLYMDDALRNRDDDSVLQVWRESCDAFFGVP